MGAILGKIPTMTEYMQFANNLNSMAADIYRYLNFDRVESYQKAAEEIIARAN